MIDNEPIYINRELSWLEFNQRVLDEALDTSLPLLERLKFLAITGSNLDEFFMVRVGSLQLLAQQAPGRHDPVGLSPVDQLTAIGRRARRMHQDQYACLLEDLDPALRAVGIRRLTEKELSTEQEEFMERKFEDELVSVMAPLLNAPKVDFPLLVNQEVVVCVQLAEQPEGVPGRFAVIPLGHTLDRIVGLPSASGFDYVLLEDVLSRYVDRLFPGRQVEGCTSFRITRNADISVREDSAGDLLSGMQQVLDARKQSACVRLELAAGALPETRQFLQTALDVADENLFVAPGPLNLAAFMKLSGLTGFDQLRYSAWPPQPSPQVGSKENLFEEILDHDVLLCQPYERYDPVVEFVEMAADDPDVLSIKQTLYRTSRNSAIIAALRRAAENGKSVTVIVELKARFDEARNIQWAKRLEETAVNVVYGVKGLKTHAKICLVLRRSAGGLQRFVHYGTGNYNENTACLYSDISFMTADEALTGDAASFFHAITGYSQPQSFRKIEAAPIGLRERVIELIEAETRHAVGGRPAHIMAQLNSLVDTKVINALYRAARAGVRIDLNIRGICCLRPGHAPISENIRVVSVLDRFLEHSRILYFLADGREQLFISSADWMPRNLQRRVELLVPIEDQVAKSRLKEILESYARDDVKGRMLQKDGAYRRVRPVEGQTAHRHQEHLYRMACHAGSASPAPRSDSSFETSR